MRVDPTFIDHWKVNHLKAILGKDKEAPIYILRLWAYCQTSAKSTIPNNSDIVSATCRFNGNASLFLKALIELKIVDVVDDTTLIVHQFDEYNASLLAVRANAKKATAARLSRQPTGQHTGSPVGQPTGQHTGSPVGSPTGQRMEWKGMEGNGIPPSPQGVDRGWEDDFLAELKNTGKFPALTIEALKQAARGYPKANLPALWPEIISEAVSMPGSVIGSPVAWIRAAMSRLERQNINSEKKEGAAGSPQKGQLIQIPKEWED